MSTAEQTGVFLCGAQADVRFHLSLNVSDIRRSVDFFRVLFGTEPAKQRSDYTKFECDDPPVVLPLEPNPPSGTGALNHIGFRVPNSQTLVNVQHRLESNGITTVREDGVECCYAKQTKFWLHDPDQNLWEIYTLEEDIEHRGHVTENLLQIASHTLRTKKTDAVQPAESIWAHRLGQSIPAKLFMLDESVDKVDLQGTFNAGCSDAQLNCLLAEIARVLKPDGVLKIHALTSEVDVNVEKLELPGPASVVQQVPTISKLMSVLQSAGFINIGFEKYGSEPCFVAHNAAMRETRLLARKALSLTSETGQSPIVANVLYKGPGISVLLGDGTHLEKGVFTPITQAQLVEIQNANSEDFVFGAPAA